MLWLHGSLAMITRRTRNNIFISHILRGKYCWNRPSGHALFCEWLSLSCTSTYDEYFEVHKTWHFGRLRYSWDECSIIICLKDLWRRTSEGFFIISTFVTLVICSILRSLNIVISLWSWTRVSYKRWSLYLISLLITVLFGQDQNLHRLRGPANSQGISLVKLFC